MIDRYLLRYFLAVIDEGNFSRAALRCNVTQPALSIGIAKLEASLGCKLFHRTNRRVSLTQSGVELTQRARRIEAEFLAAEREAAGTVDTPTIRIGILSTISGEWIEAAARKLRLAHPQRQVEFVDGRERSLAEQLQRGRIDVALTVLRPGNRRMIQSPLFSEGYSLAISANHPLAGLEVIEAMALAGEPMIVRRNCELLPETSRFFTERGIRPFFPARTTNDDQAIRLVRAGLGLTVMPDCFRAAGIARPKLAEFTFTREIGLLFAPHLADNDLAEDPALKALAEIITDNAEANEALTALA